MKRQYQQNCALANALDRVGERWTLLIVRELLTGDRRYGELAEQLPGMGTNLLAARLKDLQAEGLVIKDGSGYRLTDLGRLLEPAVHALVRFGLALDQAPDPDWHHDPRWDAVAIKALYAPERDPGLQGEYGFELDGVAFRLLLDCGCIHVEQGDPVRARAWIRLDKPTGRDLAAGRCSIDEARNRGGLTLEGAREETEGLLQALGFPVATAGAD